MIWQHLLILESICETNSIKTFFPAEQTGFFTALLTRSPFLFFSLLLGQIFPNPTPCLIFTLQINYSKPHSPSPFSFWKTCSKSNVSFLFLLPGLKILSPTPILQKLFKPNFLYDLKKFLLFIYPFSTPATGVQRRTTKASFGIGVCGFLGRYSVLKRE